MNTSPSSVFLSKVLIFKKSFFIIFAAAFLMGGFFVAVSPALAATTLFSDGFESNSFSAWTSHDTRWTVSSSDTHGGTSYKAVVNGNTGGNDDVLLKNISTLGYNSVALSYWYKASSMEASDHVYVEYSIDGGSNWLQLKDYTNQNVMSDWVQGLSFLPSSADNNASLRVRFRGHMNNASDTFFLDDVSIAAMPIPSATNSTLTCFPTKQIVGGLVTCNIAVKDQSNNPISGISVDLSANGSNNSFSTKPVLSDINGNTTITLSSNVAQTENVIATAGVTTISTTPSIEFYVSSPTTASITASPKPQEASLSGSSVNLTISITDQHGNPANDGIVVNVSGIPSTSGTVIVSGSGNTASGQVTRTLNFNNKGDVALTVNISSIGNLALTGDSIVHFIDTIKPVITITPPNPAEVEYRGTYSDAGATAFDNIDGDITINIITTNLVTPNIINVVPNSITKIVGVYTVTYNVSDSVPNAATPAVRTVNVLDRTAPVIASITSNATPAGALKIGDTITFTLTPTPAEPIATVNGSYNSHVLTWSTSNSGVTYTATHTVIEGDADRTSPWQITGVTMTDEAGNVSNPANGTDVVKTIDAHRPILTSIHIESNNAHNNLAKVGDTVTLTFTSNEAISTPIVTIAGHTTTVTGGLTEWAATYVMQSSDTEGIVLFTISGFSDLAGNSDGTVISTTDASSVTFDKTAPALSKVTPVPTPTNDNTPNYTFSSDEAGIITYSGSCASGNLSFAVDDDNTITYGLLPDATYFDCTIVVTDAAGNPSNDLEVNTFTVDIALPIVAVTNFPNVNISNQNIVTISGTCSEEGLPVSIMVGSVNNNTHNCSSGNWSYTLDLSLLTDGNLTATASQTDTANNTGSGSKASVKDTVAPTVTGLSDDSNPRKSKTWSWGSSEIGSVFRYIINTNSTWDTPVGDFSGIVTATQPDGNGTYYIHVQAQDAVGNIGNVTSVFATLDNTSPAIDQHDGILEVANATGGKNVIYTVTANDTHDGAIIPICTPVSGFFFLVSQTTTVTCNATDQAGNVATPMTFNVTVNPDTITHITLIASPTSLAFSQTSLITITGKDQHDNTVTNNDSTVIVLSADGGGSLDNTILTLSEGVATTNLSKDSVGIVHVTASSVGLSPQAVIVTFTKTDTSSPFVESHIPINGATGVALNIHPILIFSEPLDTITVSSSNIQLRKYIDNSVVLSSVSPAEGDRQVIITPTNPLDFSTSYYFAVSAGVTDKAGNLAEVLNEGTKDDHTFTTLADNTVLAVTNISALKTFATADGTYENGWAWIFHITVPTNETDFAMKFADWTSVLPNTIPVANNVRYSSLQADNGPFEITEANVFGGSLNLTSDLESGIAGRQIQVKVEAKIPVDSAGGSYSTSYGVYTD